MGNKVLVLDLGRYTQSSFFDLPGHKTIFFNGKICQSIEAYIQPNLGNQCDDTNKVVYVLDDLAADASELPRAIMYIY